ncbi:helix-turn-helix domain-containing protein [Verrucomicrobia bacterium]|nr:helix-turn-helix domain-containing protein [Verrucomicrobiota bacterium]
MIKLTPKLREKVVELRAQGMTYPQIAKKTKMSRQTAMKIVKDHRIEDKPLEARILKPCINPRIMMIYFGEDKNSPAKCVIRVDRQYPINSPVTVKAVEGDETLYRLA